MKKIRTSMVAIALCFAVGAALAGKAPDQSTCTTEMNGQGTAVDMSKCTAPVRFCCYLFDGQTNIELLKP